MNECSPRYISSGLDSQFSRESSPCNWVTPDGLNKWNDGIIRIRIVWWCFHLFGCASVCLSVRLCLSLHSTSISCIQCFNLAAVTRPSIPGPSLYLITHVWLIYSYWEVSQHHLTAFKTRHAHCDNMFQVVFSGANNCSMELCHWACWSVGSDREVVTWGLGSWPRTICRRVSVCFYPLNVTFFHSKLSLDNDASFTSSRMKDYVKNGS